VTEELAYMAVGYTQLSIGRLASTREVPTYRLGLTMQREAVVEEFLAEIFTLHPENSKKEKPTSKQCVAWYRSHLRNDRKTRLFVESTRGWTYDPLARRWSRIEAPAPIEDRPDLGF